MNSKNSTDPINSMNFTKPDSARIKYRLEPPEYANPDISPKPIRMKVEIKDKDGVTVYGPRDLTVEEQRNQLLWWNGIDNKGDTLDPERGPFKGEIKLKYKEEIQTTTSSLAAASAKTKGGEVTAEFLSSLIAVKVNNIKPSYKKIVAVRGGENDKLSFDYEIKPSWFTFDSKKFLIYGKDGLFDNPIYTEELTSNSGSFKWDGKCDASFGKNESGHYADPRENPFSVYCELKFEGEGKEYTFCEHLMDVNVVPQIMKVFGTHTPFSPTASCDEDNPLTLTHRCVVKGKIDNSGVEQEDILYYTGDGEPIRIWRCRNDNSYHANNGTQVYDYQNRRSYWIELYNEYEIDPEIWDQENLGELNCIWTQESGPTPEVVPQGLVSANTYSNPGTYRYNIRVTNLAEGQTIQNMESHPGEVKSRPTNYNQVSCDSIECIRDCYMVHLKGVENDAYAWAQSFIGVPYAEYIDNPNPLPNRLYPTDYHYNDCSGLIHAAEWLNGWRNYRQDAHGYVTLTSYSSSNGGVDPENNVNARRNDWAGIDPKIDKDGDGAIGRRPYWGFK